MRPMLAAGDLTFTALWCAMLSEDWKMEVPMKMHRSHGDYAADGTPEWTKEFAAWLERDRREGQVQTRRGPYENHPQRIRTTRAFRKLRRQAPQEFLALYDACVLNPINGKENMVVQFAAIARRLNDRAITKGFPERYNADIVAILVYSAVHKMSARWL